MNKPKTIKGQRTMTTQQQKIITTWEDIARDFALPISYDVHNKNGYCAYLTCAGASLQAIEEFFCSSLITLEDAGYLNDKVTHRRLSSYYWPIFGRLPQGELDKIRKYNSLKSPWNLPEKLIYSKFYNPKNIDSLYYIRSNFARDRAEKLKKLWS
jgi:hypothetical protein